MGDRADTTVRDGGCQCGAVRYQVRGEPIAVTACHCRDCQRQSGSAFGMSLVIPRDAFALLRGELRSFTRPTDSGGTMECCFCPACGTRIHHARSAMPASLNVKPGTLDDTSWLRPAVHVWLIRKQPWLDIPDDVRCYERNPR